MIQDEIPYMSCLQQQQQQQQQRYDSPYVCSPAGPETPSAVDYASYHPHAQCGDHFARSPYSAFSSVSQPPSPQSQSSAALSHHSRMSSGSGYPQPGHQVYQNWTFAPATRAQRRYVQPEVYARRRATANLRERGRMTEMNRAFDRLRNLVPTYPADGQRISKIDTLRLANQYIHDLKMLLTDQTVSEGYDFRLDQRREGDSSDGDFTSPSPSDDSDEALESGCSLTSSSTCEELSRAQH